jgi:hypothetical protein
LIASGVLEGQRSQALVAVFRRKRILNPSSKFKVQGLDFGFFVISPDAPNFEP